MFRCAIRAAALALATLSVDPAGAQRVRAGVLTCDISAGILHRRIAEVSARVDANCLAIVSKSARRCPGAAYHRDVARHGRLPHTLPLSASVRRRWRDEGPGKQQTQAKQLHASYCAALLLSRRLFR